MNNFTIKLGSLTNGKNYFSFEVRDKFFEAFTFSDIKHANIFAKAMLNKDGEKISLNLKIKGNIHQIPCDICTYDLSIEISGEADIIIQKSNENLISTDEIFYIKKNENKLNLKQLIFELIILHAPKKRKHPLDKKGNSTCNKEMLNLVNKYTEITQTSSDPRWDALKNLK